MRRVDHERYLRDREEQIRIATYQMPSQAFSPTTITCADSDRNAWGAATDEATRHADLLNGRDDIVLLGDATDFSMTKVEEWPHHYDRHALTISAGRVRRPNEHQAIRRAEKIAKAPRMTNYVAPRVGSGWVTAKDLKKMTEAKEAKQ